MGWPATASGGGMKEETRELGSPGSVESATVSAWLDNLGGRVSGQGLPGRIHPGQAECWVEPEQWLARLLPELFRLEGRDAWSRHEKWYNLG